MKIAVFVLPTVCSNRQFLPFALLAIAFQIMPFVRPPCDLAPTHVRPADTQQFPSLPCYAFAGACPMPTAAGLIIDQRQRRVRQERVSVTR